MENYKLCSTIIFDKYSYNENKIKEKNKDLIKDEIKKRNFRIRKYQRLYWNSLSSKIHEINKKKI